MKPVSATTEQALSEAMARLFDGCPRVTDGRLTVANLAVEAGVSRATANRALKVLKVFRQAVIETRLWRDAEGQPMGATRAEQERRAVNDILAQHHQVRALCELMELRRYGYNAEVIPIASRKRP
ncbi:hypothetical protein [Mesorhizobium delmotii]|uniref:Uncharacterized protein n=1 Tax=Mesorhizobium delmotii TaxID=1631247 RepID=A0A2P9AVT7_9HYPH|nr:hypothetical protein [Mesorhizobium delmotii]SJM35260.1 conserved hypothetical protein [Mesorhizobium delmotii]